MSARQWARDLAMGTRYAFAGGREGWTRALLTAVGVGLGVALLLLTTAIPNALAERDRREEARSDHTIGQQEIPKADDTLMVLDADTTFRDVSVRGRLLEPEGPLAPLPPGVAEFPAAGEMVVSPALKELLASDDGRLLRERLDYRVVGTIGEQGLVGSQELAYFAGGKGLEKLLEGPASGARIDSFGNPDLASSDPWDPVLLLLVLVVFVVLLMPVAVFIAAAVRFGGERRDRRLAALRLVGSDSRMTRRIAAGEALAGSVLGLVLGTGFFLIGRELAATAEVFQVSVFPSYLNPSPLLAVLVALAVPAAAVLVTILALRGVVIEPLGVVRSAKPTRRRLWWRLLLPLGGLALLAPMVGQGDDGGNFNQYLVVGGVMLLLVGVTALLPWVVERVVARLGSGGIAWQLAVRRLQLSSGTAARMVNGIAVAVAGAIALQMLFAGVEGQYTQASRYDVSRAQMSVQVPDGDDPAAIAGKYRDTEGVRGLTALSDVYLGDRRGESESMAQLTVADCASLREVATLPSCRDGDVFAVRGSEYDSANDHLTEPGTTLWADPQDTLRSDDGWVSWTVPKDIRQAQPREDPTGYERGGILVTPAALPETLGAAASTEIFISLDLSVPDAYEHVRNTAARLDPTVEPMTWSGTESNERYATIRTGLSVGAACVLALIGASLLVSQLEQLRERRKLLSSLVAFGTRRRTLSLSVLWQTAIPIGLGLLLAATVGIALGAVLLRMTDTSVRVDWPSVLSMTGIGAGVVLVVTLLSLPPLWKLMRPEGLRTE
ncbi:MULTISPECIES: ABC transporter permease [Streptomyces]|uniref:ABC transporter permease n=1 Tax=Streptomyces koelreuteriae TaxID=2838015 RepID=A0ABX8FQ74_9ACTN|nr:MULTISPECIES: FtsX-like permease family protein [Streptomyces]QWB23315.1 ABC transporter permease [Streptomyces koelreuteriae]UUA06267.1 ABC transporter permease [Streptomyces koelreuteriae]UUA13894.1 ABC transporter permease [Streptomyces sp. CRCS-T-1]